MRVGILGGGTMGLTLAYRISRAGHHVTVLEAAPQVGGLATWFDYGEFVWDKYYHVILRSDTHLQHLLEDLNIAHRLRWAETKTGFLWQDRRLSMSSHWEFLTFPALSLPQKVRLAAGILYCQRIKDPSPLEHVTAAEWMSRVFGRGVYEAIWEPLLESKYGVLKDQVPATIMWATIRRYYSTRSKGGGKESMGYLAGGGLKVLFDALVERANAGGGIVHCDTPATGIDNGGPEKVVVSTGRGVFEFDGLISTLPTAVLRRTAPDLDTLFDANAPTPKFLGVIRLALVLQRPLSPYYVTNLIQKGYTFTGIIEVTSLTGTEETAGRALVMLPRYDVPESPWFDRDADEIAREFLRQMKPIWPDIEENLVRHFVHRERIVQALWTISPPPAGEPSTTEDGRIWSVNAELAGRDTLNNNAIVRVANEAADRFLRLHPGTTDCPGPESGSADRALDDPAVTG